MSRLVCLATAASVALVVMTQQCSWAQSESSVDDSTAGVVRIVSHRQSNQSAPGLIRNATSAKPINSAGTINATPVSKYHNNHPTKLGPVAHAPSPGYPQLNAPLYPSPQPMTPIYAGGTMITNQAFSPHEMLYPHQYKAMYGPYYYKVRGSWYLTPLGVRSHDRWELQGTEVSVKYRSHYKPFSFYFPPATSNPWKW
ncbi:hypothetical protein [Rubinisphaera margarita]|uniref:hypothetical protein n=1 Tax=Rubinisphaera margarita TaxID=2909586 RepID=UPI001EE985B6|nr:hypothetical protein [Rubinisphaera margarita]MCG6157050.1 hypothetical protein [Rubinisphaera margarita]